MSERKQRWLWSIGLFLACAVLSAITYWNVLLDPDQVLAFNDGNIESVMHAFPGVMYRAWDNQTFFGQPVGQIGITFNSLGESVFGPHHWRREGQAVILALCGLAIYWMLRQFRFVRPASAITAVILVLTGWCNNFALCGLAVRPIALGCAALAVGFAERGRRSGRWLPYAIGGGLLGLGVTEVPDVGLLLAIASAFIFWWTHLGAGGPPEPAGAAATGPFLPCAGRRALRFAPKFALFVAVSVLFAWQTLFATYATQIKGMTQGATETPAERYAWATQWSIPPAEMWNVVSGTYFGTSMRSDSHPYWGRMGRSAGWEQSRQGFRNFTNIGWHLGVVPCILLLGLFAIALRRQPTETRQHGNAAAALEVETSYAQANPRAFALMLGLGAAVSMMLMWGKHFPLYRLFWSLPYLGTFRNPDKWNGPFTLFAGLGIACMLDLLVRHVTTPHADPARGRQLRRALLGAAGAVAGLALLILIGTVVNRPAVIAKLGGEGYAAQSAVAYGNAVMACVKVLLISGLFAGLVAWQLRHREAAAARPAGKSPAQKSRKAPAAPAPQAAAPATAWKTPVTLLALLAILAFGDLIGVNRLYAVGHRYRQLIEANPLTDFLDAHRTEGRLKLLPPQHPLLNNIRMTILQLNQYDLFDPISISRMPTDYAALFDALAKQPTRLWEMGSIRYFVTLAGAVQELNRVDGDRGRFEEKAAMGISVKGDTYVPVSGAPSDQQHLRVVEFTGALPKCHLVSNLTAVPPTLEGETATLERLAAPGFNPATDAIVHTTDAIPGPLDSSHSSLTIKSETTLDVKLSVTTEHPCFLVRSVKFDPDWVAQVDGQSVEVYRVNTLFQGIQVPAGTHAVSFSYQPSMRAPLTSASTRLFLLGLICINGLVGCRSRNKVT